MGTNLIDFGKRSGFQIPRVNIGAMRLPKDTDKAIELIRHAIDSGMKYIDTSRGYGDSEIKLGKALKNGYREKVILSTKWSPWIMKIDNTDNASADCVLTRIEESMKRLDVDHLDFYQVWNIQNRENYKEATKKGGFLDGIRAAMKKGLVRHTGFTSHDSVENLLSYLDEADWCEILLVTYNMLNTTYAPVLEKAKRKGIGTIVMNPLAGGLLAGESDVFGKIVGKTGSKNIADMAIRYILSNPNVDTIISGISKISDVDGSVASLNHSLLTEEEISAVDSFTTEYSRENVSFCTTCKYCMPCPQEVNIPEVMKAIYEYRYLGFKEHAARVYNQIGTNAWTKGNKADACTECGECIEKCTQKIDIPKQMNFAKETFK